MILFLEFTLDPSTPHVVVTYCGLGPQRSLCVIAPTLTRLLPTQLTSPEELQSRGQQHSTKDLIGKYCLQILKLFYSGMVHYHFARTFHQV